MRAPIGMKIRRFRQTKGLSQTQLAQNIGISPSYLNLIESSKRDVGGALLLRIAEELDVKIEELSGAREQKTLQLLQELLGDPLLQGIALVETDLREFLARFPELAHALLRLSRASSEAAAEIESLESRFSSDPVLAQMLHEALNRLTGVRSSAEILAALPDLTEAERGRFTTTLTRDASDLSQQMRSLVGYFDQSVVRRRGISPVREVEDAFIAANNHFPALEALAERLRGLVPAPFSEPALVAALQTHCGIAVERSTEAHLAPPQRMGGQANLDTGARILRLRASAPLATRLFRMCQQMAELLGSEALEAVCDELAFSSPEARKLGRNAAANYVAGAMMMPYDSFLALAEQYRYDIDFLSHAHNASFEQVAQRLVTLRRPGAEGVAFGFLRADPTGRLTKRFPLPGLGLPGGGHGCLLWPLYGLAGSSEMRRQMAIFPNGARFLLLAKAVPKRVAAWDEQPLTFSIMLACALHQAERTVYAQGLNLSESSTFVEVGPACRLCPRKSCSHRQEEAQETPT